MSAGPPEKRETVCRFALECICKRHIPQEAPHFTSFCCDFDGERATKSFAFFVSKRECVKKG